MTNLNSLLKDASTFVSSEFGFDIEKSELKPYSADNWQRFCESNGFDLNSSGIYVPKSHSAYVRVDSPFLTTNVFHELYGHGLFVEHSQIGKKLTEIIKEEGDEQSFMFDKVNQKEQLFGITERNIHNYEGFATWFEALLCNETNNSNVWEAKKQALREDYTKLFEIFEDAEHKLGRFGLISQIGLPKYYDEDKVLDVVKKMYGSTFNSVDFVLLYGSQKPESDIDLCIVSNNESNQYFNGWLDIAELNQEDFKYRLRNLDIALTDAMMTGKLIHGDKNSFHKLKQRIQDEPITKEIIAYNQAKSDLQKEYYEGYIDDERMKKLCLSYSDSYAKNAEQLNLGNKPLTLANINHIYAE